MSWSWGYNEVSDIELREQRHWNSIISDDGDVCTEKTKVLVEVPSKRIEIIDHKTIDRLCEMGWERHDGMVR